MFCGNCGAKISDDASFCPECGAPIEVDDYKYSSGNKKSGGSGNGNHKKTIVAIVVAIAAVVVILGVVIGYLTIGMDHMEEKLANVIDDSEIEEYIEMKDKLHRKWKRFGIFDAGEKNDVIAELRDLKKKVEAFEDGYAEIEKLANEKEDLKSDQDDYKNYVKKLEDCQKAFEEHRASDALALLEEVKKDEENLRANKGTASTKETKGTKETKDVKAEEEKKKAEEEKKKAEEEAKMAANAKPLDISVQQVDASSFPTVRLYLNVKDSSTGNVPTNLQSNFFYINKQDANAQFIKTTVKNVNQLNGKEALKTNMVADISGSMSGGPLNEAKNIMSNFVNSVQFGAGDQVGLIAFADGVYHIDDFIGDANQLITDINGLTTHNMTSLYDALYTAVQGVASQNGAKCVIAFTDGLDNYSTCTADDVIALANRYHVPVFIIGIGDADYTEVSYIAGQTGGKYYNVYDVVSMQDIYNEIYRMEKELYLLEFEDTTGATIMDQANIQVGYKGSDYKGECTYTYIPNTLVSVDSQVLFPSGPESVVERYMKGFDDAMTNMDFSYIADTLLPGSNIYNGQQSYIMQGIKEHLDAYEIVSTVYSDANNCVITTRETYTLKKPNKPIELMTQQAQYAVTYTENGWKIHDFAGEIQVLSRIKQ